jgi:hypothetical protein
MAEMIRLADMVAAWFRMEHAIFPYRPRENVDFELK